MLVSQGNKSPKLMKIGNYLKLGMLLYKIIYFLTNVYTTSHDKSLRSHKSKADEKVSQKLSKLDKILKTSLQILNESNF